MREERRREDELLLADRPLTRADCEPGGDHHFRPCPFVSCRHNLFPHGAAKQPWEVDPNKSCLLDVADDGGARPEEAAAMLGITVGEAQEAEAAALAKIQAGEDMGQFELHAARSANATPLGDLCSAFAGGVDKGLEEDQEDRTGRVLPDRLYIRERLVNEGQWNERWEEADVPDEEYVRAFYKVYERESRQRAEDLDRVWLLFKKIIMVAAWALGDNKAPWPQPPPKKKSPGSTKGMAWRGRRMTSPRRR